MLQKIAEVVGLTYVPHDAISTQVLNRIYAKMPVEVLDNPDTPAFLKAVQLAEKQVNSEGQFAIVQLVKQITAPPPEKVYKIKRSAKGDRISVAAPNGIRYSYGPIWNDSVKAGKGIAAAECNRAKLNHQALMVGVDGAETLSTVELCAKIAATFSAK
jgi:hypothetical protein